MKVLVIFLLLAVASGSTVVVEDLNEFLVAATKEGIVDEKQVENLLEFASARKSKTVNVAGADTREDAPPGGDGIFMKMYNQLTLLNVLYFGGALLIIGAYTLLMNLAWEHFNSTGISVLMILKTLVFGVGGVAVWNTSYQFLGGLLCTISTGLVPYTVYWIQKALQVWPVDDPGVFQEFRIYIRPGWVAMEIATVIVGLAYLVMIRFPFLLAPVSFSLWFLSMDVTPILSFISTNFFDLRLKVSIAFGLGLIFAGRGMEYALGSHPDFGYWLYLFGLIAFWFSLSFNSTNPTGLSKSLYLLINVALVIVGSHLNRVTFKLFGTAGVLLVSSTILTGRGSREGKSVLFWLLKALAAIALLSESIKNQGTVELINASICIAMFNVESLLYITTSEFYSLLLLVTNLGFVSVVPSLNYTLSLWIVELSVHPQILGVVSLTVLLYHIRLFKYYATNNSELTKRSTMYIAYKGVMSVAVTLVFVFLRQPWFVWVGGVGLPIIAMRWQPERRQEPNTVKDKSIQYVLLLASVLLSVYLQSNMLYLISCLCLVAALFSMFGRDEWVYAYGCGLATLLIFLSVPLQLKFLIAIGGVYVFGYLSHLAYVVFNKSVLFPLSLIGLGLLMIYTGVMYQYYQEAVYEFTVSFIPETIHSALANGISEFGVDWYTKISAARFTFNSIWSSFYLLIFYPGIIVHALVHDPMPYAGIGCTVGMVIVSLLMLYAQLIVKFCPDTRSEVKVTSMKLLLNKSGKGDGIIIHIEGTKPSNTILPKYVSMNINGERFWSSMQSHFNSLAVSLVRSAMLPYQLTPHLIKFNGFEKGSTRFSAVISLGTGEQGKPSIKRSVIVNNARRVSGSNSTMYCTLLYSTAFYLPYSPMCSYDLTVSEACEMLLLEEK